MAKVGYEKSTKRVSKAIEKQVKKETKKHSKVGDLGGREYKVKDATQRLIHTIGAGFFNEPNYYQDDSKTNSKGISEGAKALMKTMKEVAEEAPEDFMVILSWARDQLHLRTTTEVGLAVASRVEGCRELLPLYEKNILTRADQIRNVFAAYRHLYCQDAKSIKKGGHPMTGTFPKKLSVALGQAFSRFNEYDFLKWDGGDSPHFKDVLLMIKQKTGKPVVSKEVFEYLVNGKVIDGDKTPVIYHREQFNKSKNFKSSLDHAIKGQITWEVFVSKWGKSDDPKTLKECWEWLINNKRLGYMACLRNLRNFEDANISSDCWDKVYDLLTNKETDHKQYPFRFMAARKNVKSQDAISAVDKALDNSVNNLPQLPGNTLAMVDLSGSMDSHVSTKSTMTNKEIGASLCAIFAKMQGRKTSIWGFGDSQREISFSESDSTMSIANRIMRTNVGHSTIPGPIIKWALDNNKKFDRIVIFSDLCCYKHGGRDLPTLLAQYQAKYPDTVLYSINLASSTQGSQADPSNPKVCLLSGFSEAIFRLFQEFEGIGTEDGKAVPTIDQLRKQYLIQS